MEATGAKQPDHAGQADFDALRGRTLDAMSTLSGGLAEVAMLYATVVADDRYGDLRSAAFSCIAPLVGALGAVRALSDELKQAVNRRDYQRTVPAPAPAR